MVLALTAICAASNGFRVHADEPALLKVTYGHATAEDSTPTPRDRADTFYPDQTIFVSVELHGRLRSGVVGAGLYFQEQLIAESHVDLEEASPATISPAGNTVASFQFKPQGVWPQSTSYRTELSFEGRALGSFPFRILPPKDAIASRLKSWKLSKHADFFKRGGVEASHEFGPQDRVELSGVASVGAKSWLQIEWKVAGEIDQAGTRELAVSANKSNAPFSFSFLPNGGWPVGMQEVILTMNGREVVREKFAIRPALDKILAHSVKLHD